MKRTLATFLLLAGLCSSSAALAFAAASGENPMWTGARPQGPLKPRFHVRGFNEQGTTTTPFDMVVLNEMSRYHLAAAALRWANRADLPTSALIAQCRSAIESATAYAYARFEDPPDIQNWIWTD